MNRGLTDVLKKHFTDLILVEKPVVELRSIDNLEWITGFVDGEGSFDMDFYSKSSIFNRL
jgi:hypothetical protein